MSLYNTPTSYGRIAQWLHWSVAVLILFLLALGLWMDSLPTTTQEEVARAAFLYSLHKTLGILTLLLVLLRIAWALVSVRPGLLNADRRLEAFAAVAIHWLLYGAILLMPLSGWLYHAAASGGAPIWWPFGLELGQGLPLVPKDRAVARFFGTLHWALSWVIIVAVALHVLGALKHALIDRDGTLSRMLPWGRATAVPPARQPSHVLPALAAILLLAAVIAVAAAMASDGYRPPAQAPAPAASSGATSPDAGSPAPAVQAAGSGPAIPAGGAPAWIVDAGSSRLAIEVQLMGSAVAGSFAGWSADIRFDPEDLPASAVEVQVDIGSLSLGDVGEQALSPAYLDVAGHPTARFAATSFRRTGDGQYEAEGELTLRGRTAPVTLPFALVIEGEHARVRGRTRVDRLAFGVGAEAMPGDDTLGFPVEILVELSATRAAAE